MNTYKK